MTASPCDLDVASNVQTLSVNTSFYLGSHVPQLLGSDRTRSPPLSAGTPYPPMPGWSAFLRSVDCCSWGEVRFLVPLLGTYTPISASRKATALNLVLSHLTPGPHSLPEGFAPGPRPFPCPLLWQFSVTSKSTHPTLQQAGLPLPWWSCRCFPGHGLFS